MSIPSSDSAAIRQIIRALRAAGWQLDSVHDGDYYDTDDTEVNVNADGNLIVTNETEAIEAIMAVDFAHLFVRREGDADPSAWVLFVLGNSPDEVACDYTTNLDAVISPLYDKWND